MVIGLVTGGTVLMVLLEPRCLKVRRQRTVAEHTRQDGSMVPIRLRQKALLSVRSVIIGATIRVSGQMISTFSIAVHFIFMSWFSLLDVSCDTVARDVLAAKRSAIFRVWIRTWMRRTVAHVATHVAWVKFALVARARLLCFSIYLSLK